jgi:hypothetical protein
MSKFDYWTDRDGKKVLVSDLSDRHFRNIIRDGYRNPRLRKEAIKRGLNAPEIRIVDINALFIHKEAVYSCAIEGIGKPEDDIILKLWREKDAFEALKALQVLQNRMDFDDLN